MRGSPVALLLCFSMMAACGCAYQSVSSHSAWARNNSTALLKQHLIIQDRRLGEITDLLPVVTGEDDRRLLVLGSRGILSIRQPDAAASEFEPVQYTAIKRPPEIEGFGNHAFHDVDGRLVVLQSGEPDSTVTLACYSLAGDLLWKVDPDFVRRTGWENRISSVQVLRNAETNSCRILGLSFGNETAVIISAEGQVLSRSRAGPVNSGLFGAAPWRGTGTAWTGCIFGSRDNVVGVDGDGNILFSTRLPKQEKYVSEVRPLRPLDDGPEQFLVLGIRSPENADVHYVLEIRRAEDERIVPRFSPVSADAIWARTALIPLRSDHKLYFAQSAVVETQASPAGIAGRALRISLWDQEGTRVGVAEFAAAAGEGRFGQVVGKGAICSWPQHAESDALLVGWGDCLWLVTIAAAP